MTIKCERCGKETKRKPSYVRKHKRLFCSQACKSEGFRVSPEHKKLVHKLWLRRWRAANPDKLKAYWNSVSNREWWRRYREKNANKLKAYWVDYHQAHAAKKIQRSAQWRVANIERARLNSRVKEARRRARKREAEGHYSAQDIELLHRRQKGRCAYCRKSLRRGFDIDHIKPLAKGGSNWPSNLQLLCASCNRRKHALTPEEYGRRIGLLL